MLSTKSYKDKIRERFLNKKMEASLTHSPFQQIETKLNSDYLREENEIQLALTERLLNKGSQDNKDEEKLRKEIAFFTDIVNNEPLVPESDISQTDPINDSLKSNKNMDDTPTHMASSYVQIDDSEPIEKIKGRKLQFDDDLLYFPQLEMPNIRRRLNGSISNKYLNATKEEEDADFVEHDKKQPKILKINLAQMYNRFIEENNADWFDKNTGEMLQLQTFSSKVNIIKNKKWHKLIPTYLPPTNINENYMSYILDNKILQIFIQHIKFNHHALMSEENVLINLIEKDYNEYKLQNDNLIIEITKEKLTILRNLINELENNFNKNDIDIIKEKKLKEELKDLRNYLHRQEKIERDLIKKILYNWKTLKSFYKTNKINKYKIKIVIQMYETNLEEDHIEWNERFNEEFNEIMDETKSFYISEKKRLQLYKKELKKKRNDYEHKLFKLNKPNAENIKEQLLDIYLNSLRHPGEPIILLELIYDNKEIPLNCDESINIANDNNERKRLQHVNGRKFIIKMIFDNVVVGTTKSTHMDDNFLVNFNALFTIKITIKLPQNIKFEIYELSKYNSDRLCDLFIPIPTEEDLYNNNNFEFIEFANDKNIINNIGVGCGNYYNNIYTNGYVKLKIGWTNNIDKNKIHNQNDNNNIRKDNDITSIDKQAEDEINKWLNDNLSDFKINNNNKTEMQLERFKHLNGMNNDLEKIGDFNHLNENKKYFRINNNLLTFLTETTFNNNKRLNLLIARFNNEIKYKDVKFIPNFEREIELPSKRDKIINEIYGTEPIDLQRHRGKNYLKNVYNTITNYIKVISNDNNNWDILIGNQLPTFDIIIKAFLQIFSPRRPLKPTRRTQPSRTSCRINDVNKFNIIINVVRGFGIPIRHNDQVTTVARQSSNLSSTQHSFKAVNVRPFVVINLKDKIVRTLTTEGSNPTWNEQLVIPLDTHLDQLKGTLCIQLFDEYIEELIDDDRQRSSEIYQRISNKWLGELRIPIGVIYSNPRIEGIFELTTPQLLFGYTQPTLDSYNISTAFVDGLHNMRGPIYLSLFISLEPIINIPNVMTNCLECTELLQTKKHIDLWFMEIKNLFPLRTLYHPLITLINGKRVCITRLIGIIQLPFTINDDIEYLIRRYVSLIPVYQTMDQCTQLNGVWLTNDQILNLMSASPKDLAVLLTCFYISMNYSAWLILGHSLTHGDTSFVLIRDMTVFYIIDPTTGKKYNSKDVYCPLIKIYCLVNDKNVWANIQRENRAYMTRFDVTKSNEWSPLFSKPADVPVGIVHDVSYKYQNPLNTKDLERMIEMKLVKKINTWRSSHRTTIWNRYVNENLHKIMLELEKDACFDFNSERLADKLKTSILSHKINGFSLNMRYTSLSSIVERIKATGIHMNWDNRVEFSISIYIESYPSNVYSLWVFLVSIVPKN